MNNEEVEQLEKQEDAVFEAGIKGIGLFALAFVIICGLAFLINYIGF